jgi:RHS repeat-associated protein
VKKVTQEATMTFFYDGWNLVEERIAYTNGTTTTIRYFWGKDLSGTLQGAGSVGGLLYQTVDGVPYIPNYDNNGNVTRYLDANGNVVAAYTYDVFGKLMLQTGPLVDFFRHRFSTKYYDTETGSYYYGYRFYHPVLMRWLNRDPMAENGGLNLYVLCSNDPACNIDTNGCAYIAYRRLDNPINKLTGVVWSEEKERKNRVWAHQQIFFEDGKSPSNVGFFDDGIHSDNDRNIKTTWIITRTGLKDACLRIAVSRVPPLPYSLFGDKSKDIEQYNCQDWIDEVLAMYDSLIKGSTYYPSSRKFIGGR